MEKDPLFSAAITAIQQRGRASAVVLQRALNIGYARATKLLDELTQAGLLGPDRRDGSREIKIQS